MCSCGFFILFIDLLLAPLCFSSLFFSSCIFMPVNQCSKRNYQHDAHKRLVSVKSTHLGGIQAKELEQKTYSRIDNQIDEEYIARFQAFAIYATNPD